jgi:serine/threonine protein kinase
VILCQELGRGAFGSVWEVEHVEPPLRRFALKRVSTPSRAVADALQAELALIRDFHHDNIVAYHDHFTVEWTCLPTSLPASLSCLYLRQGFLSYAAQAPSGVGGCAELCVVLELAESDLAARIGRAPPLSTAQRHRLAEQAAEGLQYLHDRRRVAHRDIKVGQPVSQAASDWQGGDDALGGLVCA